MREREGWRKVHSCGLSHNTHESDVCRALCVQNKTATSRYNTRVLPAHTHTRTHLIEALHLHLAVSGRDTEIKYWVITFTSLFSMVTASDRSLGSASKPCCTHLLSSSNGNTELSYMYDLGVTATRRPSHFSAIHAQPTPTQRSGSRKAFEWKLNIHSVSFIREASVHNGSLPLFSG